jgi:hypothetical protein
LFVLLVITFQQDNNLKHKYTLELLTKTKCYVSEWPEWPFFFYRSLTKKLQFNPFESHLVTQQNVEKVKGCEHFLNALYRLLQIVIYMVSDQFQCKMF